jgi:ATP-dependent helicase HrpB
MSATLDLQPSRAAAGMMRPSSPRAAAASRSRPSTSRAAPELRLEQQVAQVLRSRRCARMGDVLCFCRAPPRSAACSGARGGGSRSHGARLAAVRRSRPAPRRTRRSHPRRRDSARSCWRLSIAETSLTIEGVRVVVDSGLRRYAEFDPATGMSRLVTGKVSQAAADQRRGRAGRLSAGTATAVVRGHAGESLAPQTPPEILHADLAPLALELACWGAVDARACAGSIRRRRRRSLRRATCCGARAPSTPRSASRRMAAAGALGTHPRLAHMLIKARENSAPRVWRAILRPS